MFFSWIWLKLTSEWANYLKFFSFINQCIYFLLGLIFPPRTSTHFSFSTEFTFHFQLDVSESTILLRCILFIHKLEQVLEIIQNQVIFIFNLNQFKDLQKLYCCSKTLYRFTPIRIKSFLEAYVDLNNYGTNCYRIYCS